MSLLDKLRGELIDIIEWTEPSQSDILAYRFPRYQNEIKNGAMLTVREGQSAVFVNEGQIADVFSPGLHRLETSNLPILATLKGWKYGFNSPFKAEVYFVSTRQRTDQKWGTANPIMLRDPEFGPMRIRAFGTYAFRVADAGMFLKELVATDPSFETYEIANQLRSMIVSRFTDAIAGLKLPVLDLAGNYENVSRKLKEPISVALAGMGLGLTQFYVENVSLPEEVEKALDQRSRIGVLGNLDQYAKIQAADALRDAAQNPSGGAGIGAGLGAGIGMGQMVVNAMTQSAGAASPPASSPPPLPQGVKFYVGVNGVQQGPFDLETLAAKVRDGAVQPKTLVWKSGMANWSAAGEQPELKDLFGAVPPPLPKG